MKKIKETEFLFFDSFYLGMIEDGKMTLEEWFLDLLGTHSEIIKEMYVRISTLEEIFDTKVKFKELYDSKEISFCNRL